MKTVGERDGCRTLLMGQGSKLAFSFPGENRSWEQSFLCPFLALIHRVIDCHCQMSGAGAPAKTCDASAP